MLAGGVMDKPDQKDLPLTFPELSGDVTLMPARMINEQKGVEPFRCNNYRTLHAHVD